MYCPGLPVFSKVSHGGASQIGTLDMNMATELLEVWLPVLVYACQSDRWVQIYPVLVIKLSIPMTYLLSGLRSFSLETQWESAGFSPTHSQEQCLHMT